MTHLTPRKWRELVQKEIGAVPDAVWKTFIENENEYIDVANDESDISGETADGLNYLLERIEIVLKNFHRTQSKTPQLPKKSIATKKVVNTINIPFDNQIPALSRVIAFLLNREADILEFRKVVLGGQLLAPSEIWPWLEKVSEEEPFKKEKHLHKLFWLSYPQEDGKPFSMLPVKENGSLHWLSVLAKKYKVFWKEASAVYFILTGRHVPIRKTEAAYGCDEYNTAYISLRVPPSLSGDEVRSLYLDARKHIEGLPGVTDPRGLTEKHLVLAVFAVEEHGSWRKKLRNWNCKYPDWIVKDRSTFARDCRDAYERLTGWKWVDGDKKIGHIDEASINV